MAAPQGNKNALGGSGGKSLQDRKQAAEVRRLALAEIEKVLLGDDCDYKKQLVLKLAGTVLPRLNEHTGEDGGSIQITVSKEGAEKYDLDPSAINNTIGQA
jgi:hypothetical protein